jgi:hypothetical protein
MKPDPQVALLDAMTAEQVLQLLGPSWERMSAAERSAYGRPSGLSVPRDARTTARRRWWEAA